MKYIVDVEKTIDNFYERNNTYKKAIENCKDLAHLSHILTGFKILVNEWQYATNILRQIPGASFKIFLFDRVLLKTTETAKNKVLEIYREETES